MSRQRPVVERSENGRLILRVDNVLLVRGSRGTWLLDLQIPVGGALRRLQVPIGRHKVFDKFAVEILRADAVPSTDVEDDSRE